VWGVTFATYSTPVILVNCNHPYRDPRSAVNLQLTEKTYRHCSGRGKCGNYLPYCLEPAEAEPATGASVEEVCESKPSCNGYAAGVAVAGPDHCERGPSRLGDQVKQLPSANEQILAGTPRPVCRDESPGLNARSNSLRCWERRDEAKRLLTRVQQRRLRRAVRGKRARALGEVAGCTAASRSAQLHRHWLEVII
jgi:hypothetical protein